MKEFDIKEHEAKLKAMNERIKKGENVDVQTEISQLLSQDTWLYKLKEYLRRKVNAEFSDKRKAQFEGHEEEYFSERQEEERKIIFGTNWQNYFETKVELKELESFDGDCTPLDPATLMQISIQALKKLHR